MGHRCSFRRRVEQARWIPSTNLVNYAIAFSIVAFQGLEFECTVSINAVTSIFKLHDLKPRRTTSPSVPVSLDSWEDHKLPSSILANLMCGSFIIIQVACSALCQGVCKTDDCSMAAIYPESTERSCLHHLPHFLPTQLPSHLCSHPRLPIPVPQIALNVGLTLSGKRFLLMPRERLPHSQMGAP